jgi:hypothetical protein
VSIRLRVAQFCAGIRGVKTQKRREILRCAQDDGVAGCRRGLNATVARLFCCGGGGVQDYVQGGYLGGFGVAVYEEALAVFGYVIRELIG